MSQDSEVRGAARKERPPRLSRHSRSDRSPRWRTIARGSIPYLSVAAAGFIIAYLFMAFVVFPGGSSQQEVEIPSVVGLSYDEAAQRLISYGFSPERGEERYDANAPVYTVLSQTPRAGLSELIGASIRLDVSRGQLRGEVPFVSGRTREEAEAILADAGMEVGEVTSRRDAEPRGQVIASMPTAGTSVPLPSTVNLVISAGPPTVELPDVTGEQLPHARALLEQLGLRTSITWDSLSYMSTNTVVGQTPAAGQTVRAGFTVDLIVAGRP